MAKDNAAALGALEAMTDNTMGGGDESATNSKATEALKAMEEEDKVRIIPHANVPLRERQDNIRS
jgi:hypothetical protein